MPEGVAAVLLAAGVWAGAPRRAGSLVAEARQRLQAGAPREAVLAALERAERADRRTIEAKVIRASVLGGAGDFAAAGRQYAEALQLNPGDVMLRLAYADALRRNGQQPAAREQLSIALAWNDQLPPREPRRLPPQLEAAIRREVDAASGQTK